MIVNYMANGELLDVIDSRSILAGVQGFKSLPPHMIQGYCEKMCYRVKNERNYEKILQ